MDDLDEDYWNYVEVLREFGDEIGVPAFFWLTFFDLQDYHSIGLFADYFYLWETDERVRATPETPASQVTNKIRTGAHFACQFSVPFSKEWYICQAADHLRKCHSGPEEDRMRSSFNLGKAIAEAQWKEKTENQLISAQTMKNTRVRAGEGGARSSRSRKQASLDLLMMEIEKLAHAARLISEDRIVEQAIDAAREREPSFPKSKKTLEDYVTALRSEEPFKSRYDAVFRKNA